MTTFPASTDFVDVAKLEVLLKKPQGSLAGDAYTAIIVEAAQDLVRDTGGHPEWVGTLSAPGDVVAPPRACTIALWVSARAWSDPLNQNALQRQTAGPISDTFFEPKVAGLALSADEQAWLEGQSGASGLWVQPVSDPYFDARVFLPDGAPGADAVYMDDGSWAQAYGPVV